MKSWLSVALALQLSLTVPVHADTVSYDVSGPDGKDDQDGDSYSGHAGRGQDGRNGGDAEVLKDSRGRLLKKGYDAGDLNLTLSVVETDPKNLKIQIEGSRRGPEETQQEVVRDSHNVSGLALRFRAKGGKGGKGGNGGRGEDGGKGHDGSDATRYSWGTDGGPGGDGGDEGDSTDGGAAGEGGKITLRVGIRDTDAAMLVDETNVEGNKGGERGKGQGVGEGGAGGDGGSSHSWTTYNTVSDGKGGTTQEAESHYNPGGSDGPSGSDGRHSTKTTHDGPDSRSGKFIYQVVDEDGKVAKYDDFYDLTLLPNFELVGALNNNGFFEPGETITIKNISVVNSGQAPTPKYQKLKLFMENNGRWIVSDSIELTLPKVLEPGEKYTFDSEVIHFHLAEKPRREPGLMRELDVVGPEARVTRVERKFRRFHADSAREIKVQYPIEITPLESLVTLAPGEVAKAFFRIRNISQQTIGKMPQLDARLANTLIKRVGGDVQLDSFVLVDPTPEGSQTAVDPAQGIGKAVEGLKPGEERILEVWMGYQGDATDYAEAIIQPELYLQSILEPTSVNLIQFEPFTLRVANTFDFHQDSDLLLIANNSLDDKALDALRATAIVKQLKMDIWDFSYYGFFSFSQRIQDYENLFEAYRGKTLIILGNKVKTVGGSVRVAELLSPDEIIDAARRYGIKVVVLDTSGNPQNTMTGMTEPLSLPPEEAAPDQVRVHETVKKFVAEVANSVKEVQESQGNSETFTGIEQIAIRETRLWGKPKKKRMCDRARDGLSGLKQCVPEAEYYVDYTYAPKVLSKSIFGLIKRWSVGELRFRRTVDVSKASVVVLPVSEASINDPSFILGEDFQVAFDLGLNFDTKLKLLNSILVGDYSRNVGKLKLPEQYSDLKAAEPLTFARVLVNTILLDLMHEQVSIRPFAFSSRVDKKDLWDKLDLLKKLTHYDYTQFQLDAQSEEGKLMMDLIINMKYFSRRALSFWDRFSPFSTKNYQVTAVTNEMLDRLVKTVFPDTQVATEAIDKAVADLVKAHKKEKIKPAEAATFVANMLSGLSESALHAVRSIFGDEKDSSRVRGKPQQEASQRAQQDRVGTSQRVLEAVATQTMKLKFQAAECARILAFAKASKELKAEVGK